MVNKPEAEVKAFPKEHDVEYVFRIRRHGMPGSFRNLWDLDVKRMDAQEFENVVHADSLGLVIDKMGYVLEKDGY